jgi:hypothetical protein
MPLSYVAEPTYQQGSNPTESLCPAEHLVPNFLSLVEAIKQKYAYSSYKKHLATLSYNYPRIVATWFTKSSIAFGFRIKYLASSSIVNDSLNSSR